MGKNAQEYLPSTEWKRDWNPKLNEMVGAFSLVADVAVDGDVSSGGG